MDLPTLYIGMALTHATHAFREKFGTELPKRASQKGFQVLRFVGLTEGAAPDVYRTDMRAVETADYMLAVCDTPSIGLGMEITHRINTRRPLLVSWKRGDVITRMLTGAIVEHSIPRVAYGDLDDIVRALVDLRERFPRPVAGTTLVQG